MERPTSSLMRTGLVLGIFFVLLELLKAARSSQWAAMTGADWGGAVLGGVAYACVGIVIGWGVQRLLPRRVPVEIRVALGLFIAGISIWGILSLFREETPTADDALVAAVLVGLALGVLLSRKVLRASPGEVCARAAAVFGIGIFAVWQASSANIFAADRADAITRATLLALVLASVAVGLPLLLRRRRLATALLLLGVVFFVLGSSRPATAPPRDAGAKPNLVFIVSDTLRADYLARYGGTVPTPNIDALAARGTDFTQAHSLAPWTFPSMYGLFASQYPQGLSADGDDTWLEQIWRYVEDPGGVTLAEQLRDRDYRTAAMSANALLWGMPLATRGFDTLATAHPILLTREGPLRVLPFLHDALAAAFPAWVYPRPHNTTLDLAQYAGAWLQEDTETPFFLYMHYIDPHAPYDPPARYRNLEGPWPFFHPYTGGERWGIPQLVGDFAVAEEDRAYVRDLYEGEIRYMDEFVGRLLDRLDGLGKRDNTYIVFTSDHGEELWDHGGWGHGQSLHEELLHVPLIIAGPGIQTQRRDTPVSAIDLSPTMAALLNVPAGETWRGESYVDALRDRNAPLPQRPIYAQGTSNKCWPHPQQAVLAEGYKLIRHAGSDTLALYNLVADPGETRNLSETHREERDALLALLRQWLASFDSTFENQPADNGLSGEAVEQLEGMGYL